MRRILVTMATALATGLALLALLLSTALPASADVGSGASTGGGGYSVSVRVTFSGDAAPGGGSATTVSMPATCWWGSGDMSSVAGLPSLDASDSSTWLPWWDWANANTNGTFAPARLSLGPRSQWEAAVARAQTTPLHVYLAACASDAPACSMNTFLNQGGTHLPGWGPCGLLGEYGFYPPGAEPQPMVDPADLAKEAWDHMVIPDPVVGRNPQVTADGLGGATLVTLPTWFWVTNPDAVGGDTGTRTITARVGAVYATVVASTGGLQLGSPAGGTTCSPTDAQVSYRPGGPGSSPCTVTFDHSSVGYGSGFPVRASTAWDATWMGSGATSGTLDGLARDTVVDVPVAETQALVNGAR